VVCREGQSQKREIELQNRNSFVVPSAPGMGASFTPAKRSALRPENFLVKFFVVRILQPMPLKPGTSRKTISGNISEFHKGKTFAHTKAKFGKTRADKQAVAVALNTARRSGGLASAFRKSRNG
jgi:hypothetical protein